MSQQQGTTAGGARSLPPSRDVAIAAARAAADKQATDIVVLDVSKIIVITDHFVICSAGTQRQIGSVIEAVEARPRSGSGAARRSPGSDAPGPTRRPRGR